MFDVVRNNKRVVQVFLALIALPFAFFGVESYVRSVGSGDTVATIGDLKITRPQFQEALREQQERMRAAMGGRLDPKMFDTPEARKAILNDLINQRLLTLEASKSHLVVTDQGLAAFIANIDQFKVDGRFSRERYQAAVASTGLPVEVFEARLRQDLTLRQLAGSVSESGFLSKTVLDQLIALQTQTREVQELRFPVDQFLGKVEVNEAAIQKYYEVNARQFEIPEQVRVEYLVLGRDEVAGQIGVSEAEVKAWYDSHRDQYEQSETRQARHILLTGSDKAKLRTQADALLAEIRKSPKSFPELARKHSQDPGSAEKGGDLGYFGRGMMVKPFEDAVFAMKEGEISNIVESDFGLHIIQLTGVRPGKVRPLAEVRPDIEKQLREAGAARKFAELAEGFSNLVYEQADSLKPAAEKFRLTIRQSDWIKRGAAAPGPLGNEKVLTAIFSDDSLKQKRNTEAIEIGPNTLLAARVLEHRPAARQPLESVKAGIEQQLRREEAQKLAAKAGEAALAAARGGEDKGGWSALRRVSRLDPSGLPQAALAPVFKVDAAKLPGYTGVELPGAGYVVYKVSKVEAGPALDPARRQPMVQQLNGLLAQEEFQGYLAALRARYKVEINNAALEAK